MRRIRRMAVSTHVYPKVPLLVHDFRLIPWRGSTTRPRTFSSVSVAKEGRTRGMSGAIRGPTSVMTQWLGGRWLGTRVPPTTLAGMASTKIVEALAYINWTLLVGLALGVLALAFLLRQATDATKGFLGFSAFCAGLFALLALAGDASLPNPADLVIAASPQLDQARRVALCIFVVLTFASSVQLLRGRAVRWLGLAALAAGVATEAIAAFGWAGDGLRGVPLLIQMLMLSAVSGGALGSVVLAHWYLVTPRISEKPLVLTTRLLAGRWACSCCSS